MLKSQKIRHLFVAIFLLQGIAGVPPCYAMWGAHDLPWLDTECIRPCTRGHYGGDRPYCSRCIEADAQEEAKKQEHQKKTAAQKTGGREKPSS